MIAKRGNKWQVRWRDAGRGSRNRSRTFDRKSDAQAFDLEIRRRKQLGPAFAAELTRPSGSETLAEFVAGPFRAHAAALSPGSRAKYAWALEKHLGPLLDLPLSEITAPALAIHQAAMRDQGASANTRREALMYLGSILQLAVEHGRLPGNPARGLRKLDQHHRPEIDPLTPNELEQAIAAFDGRSRAIALLGGRLGLRPIEIRRAVWERFDGERLRIRPEDTKSTARGHGPRTIDVDRDTARQLRAWRLQSGGRDQIVGAMSQNALKQWGVRRLRPRAAEITHGRIADASTNLLRHSHASALHHAGYTLPAAAKRMGHAQPTHLLHYAHVLDGVRPGERYDSLDELIAAAQ